MFKFKNNSLYLVLTVVATLVARNAEYVSGEASIMDEYSKKKGRTATKLDPKRGRAAAATTKAPRNEEDTMEDFPHYGMITRIENFTVDRMKDIWDMTDKVSKEDRFNRQYINDVYWPDMLKLFRDSHFAVKEMDHKILFKRKPSALMDALLKVDSLKTLQGLVGLKEKSPIDILKIRYFEMSSASSQMHRFYAKRMRDILRDEPRIGMVALSIMNYRTYSWGSNETSSGFGLTGYRTTPGLAEDILIYPVGNLQKDIFIGIRELLEKTPDVVLKAQFDGKICQDNETLFNIEPAGLDGPYYVLFHLCLTDIKFYLLHSFAYLYNHIFQGVNFDKQEELRDAMRTSIQKKIDLFHNAFSLYMNKTGPSYQTYPGVGICDEKNWTYDDSYIKLINFLKVFVSREQALHKAGNCKQTCDLLDATYKPCPANDTNCILDDEMECLSKKKQCDAFDPPCPPGAYQCQNASSIVTTCPSNRYDRLYEYIKGYDFYFGPTDHDCQNETTSLKGNWLIEQDILVDTPHFCDVCTCYCFEPLRPLLGDFTVRYINLEPAKSRILWNYVVVGVKFERVQDQIHIRIADAKALPNKKVNISTIEWSPIKYQTNKAMVSRLDRDLRSVNLDDVVTLDPDRVVTGVRFYYSVYNGHVQYQYLGLQVITHPITEEGIVDGKKGMAKISRNANSTAHRNIYKYGEDPDGPDDPILAVGPSLPDTTSNQYIVFVGTSLVKDAAQSAIPYFDSQKLIRKDPRWLKGVGIYHKSRPGFGGFLSLKLIEYQNE